jgi:UDP-glucose 4-epimerase
MFSTRLIESSANNILGHLQVLEYARRHGVTKVLYASTSSIYGNNPVPLTEDQSVYPPNFYSVTKHSQEEFSAVYQKVYALEIIGFRFMSVYGLHEEHKGRFANLVSQFIWGIEQGKAPVVYGDGNQTRDLVNVRDVAAAFRLAIETPKRFGHTIFNVGTGSATRMTDLIALINTRMGTDLAPDLVPNPIAAGYIMDQQADLSKIREELGYRASVSIEAGIQEIVDMRKKTPEQPASLSY